MGLPWVRLDTNIFNHPKLLALRQDDEYRAIVLHLQALCYTAEYDLAGFIPASALRMLTCASDHASINAHDDAQTLLNGCLWMPAPGGWTMHGWDDVQFVSNEAKARSAKASKAAQARWAKRNGHHLKAAADD